MSDQPFSIPELLDLPERYKERYKGFISELRVRNIVLKGTLNVYLNLEAMTQRHRDMALQYDRQKFSSLIYRNGRLTILLFQQRSFLCVGGRDIADIISSLIWLRQEIRSKSYPNLNIVSVHVVNVVVNITTPKRIDVHRLTRDQPITCNTTTLFPGVIYIPNRNQLKITALIFQSGQINIVGVKTDHDLSEFIGHLYEFIKDYQIDEDSVENAQCDSEHLYQKIAKQDERLRKHLDPEASSYDWV